MLPNNSTNEDRSSLQSTTPEDDEIEPIAEGVWRVGSYMTTRKACSCGNPSCLHRRLIGAALQNLANYVVSWERYVEASRLPS